MARALVYGAQISTNLGLIRSLGQAGHDVYVIVAGSNGVRSIMRPEKASKYVKRYTSIPVSQEETLMATVNRWAEGEGSLYLFPTSDRATVFFDRHRSELASNVVYASVRAQQGQLELFSDKAEQVRLAREVGLDVPWTRAVRPGQCDEALLAEVPYPCFCKSEARFNGSKGAMKVCANAEELKEHLCNMEKAGQDTLVQELIDIKAEYAVDGVATEWGVWIPGAYKKLRVAQGKHKGVTVQASTIGGSQLGPTISKIEKFIKAMGYFGLFDLEVMSNGDKLYFCEVNLRPGAANYGFTLAGGNLPDAFIRLQEKNENFETLSAAECRNITFCNEVALGQEVDEGCLSHKEAQELLAESDFSLLNDREDPKPYARYKQLERITKMAHALKRK